MRKRLVIIVVLVLGICWGYGDLKAQSMYGKAVEVDVKMKYVYSLDEALKLAKKEKKLIFCNCFEDWAMPCHGMNKQVFSNKEFADWMDKHFVNLFMDMSTEAGKAFQKKYNIQYMAHYVILDAQGNLVHRIVGGTGLPRFQEQVARALSPKTSLIGMNERYAKGNVSKNFLREYAEVLRVANEEEKYRQVADEYFSLLKPEEWVRSENWPIFSERIGRNDTAAINYLIAHKADFIKAQDSSVIDNILAQVYMLPIYYVAVGAKKISEDEILGMRDFLKRADIASSNPIYVLWDIAYYRLKGDILKMMDVVSANVPNMDVRVSEGIDLSLPGLIETGKVEREKILDYMNRRIGEVDPRVAMDYKAALLEAGVEGGIQFENISLAAALQKAKEEGKYVFLDCYTSWCGPCKIMSKQVFVQKEVGDVFNNSCVNIKIDMEKGEGPDVAKKYGISAYPTMLILRPDGSVKYRIQGGTEASHFVVKGRYALDSLTSYSEMKTYGSLSACPLEKQADYIITLDDAGELRTKQNDIASYLKQIDGKKKYYPEVWKLCTHFSDRYMDPVFSFVLSHWADFDFVPQQELEDKTERLIFPRYIDYLNGKMPKNDFTKLKKIVENVGFRKDYSLIYLDRLVTDYEESKWDELLDCYEEEIARLSDARLRLNLDMLLGIFAQSMPSDVKTRIEKYIEKCIDTADPRALNGYKRLQKGLLDK